ncbi:hypothetical protein SPFM15_00098 [Salmonella phage SPFM15]|nr:hypothetical protein SPFM5_00093 [Salmonella phage SPFM5]VFR13722.1 hypothetical protein SPFM15_00098 [Salmonella phage SPFM15]
MFGQVSGLSTVTEVTEALAKKAESIREITAGSDVSGLVEAGTVVQVVEHRVLLLSFVNGDK